MPLVDTSFVHAAKKREDVAVRYAELMIEHGAEWEGYRIVNSAIVGRWSMGALVFIKERAWKIAREAA